MKLAHPLWEKRSEWSTLKSSTFILQQNHLENKEKNEEIWTPLEECLVRNVHQLNECIKYVSWSQKIWNILNIKGTVMFLQWFYMWVFYLQM